MAVIDLGVITDDEHEPSARGPGLPRGDLRRWVAAVVALGCLLGVTGSAAPRPHPITTLWSVPFDVDTDSFLLSGDTAFVTRSEEGMTAYGLRSGAVRWSLPDPAGESFWPVFVDAEALLYSWTTFDGEGTARPSETSAVDPGTGRTRWRRGGDIVSTFAGLAVLADRSHDNARVDTVRAVRLRDGVTVWEREAPAAAWSEVTGGIGSDLLVAVTPAGGAELISGADGRSLASGTVPWTARPANGESPPGYSGLRISGNTLTVENMDDNHQRFTSYELPALRQRWDVSIPSAGGSTDCGPVLCVLQPDGVQALDEASGERVWTRAGAINATPLDDTRVVVDYETRHVILDAATGREVADAGRAAPVWSYRTWRAAGWFLEATREPAGLTAISELVDGAVVLRGAMPGVLRDACQAQDRFLVCPTPQGRLATVDGRPTPG